MKRTRNILKLQDVWYLGENGVSSFTRNTLAGWLVISQPEVSVHAEHQFSAWERTQTLKTGKRARVYDTLAFPYKNHYHYIIRYY